MKPMKTAISVLVLALIFACGCQEDDADISSGSFSIQERQSTCEDLDNLGEYNNGPLPSHCAKIEGSQIGKEGIVIDVDGTEVTITDWTSKDGEKGEFVGFEYSVDGETIAVSVKAGNETFQEGETGSWQNEFGTSGPKAKGISNVVFCLDLSCDDDGSDSGDGSSGSDSSGDGSGVGDDGSGEGGAGGVGDDGSGVGGTGGVGDDGGSGTGSDPSDDSDPTVVV